MSDNAQEKGATVRLKQFTRQAFHADGTPDWKITAEDAYIYRTGGKESRIVAYKVDFQQYEKSKKSSMQAERGEIDYKNKVLFLTGQVSYEDATRRVKSSKLKYSMSEKLLETDEPVTLIESGTTTNCNRGITVDRNSNVQICRAPAVIRVGRSGDKFEEL